MYKVEFISNKNTTRFALKKLKSKINKETFLNSNQSNEVKLMSKLSRFDFIVKYEDCFFDECDYFYIVNEYCEVDTIIK